MCGIAGLLRDDGGPVDAARLERMADAIAHRGPDGRRTHLEPGLGLAHLRLAVIDLEGGAQPMSNADGRVTVVFNGEIYNYRDLRRQLEALGHAFATASDTETIVHGWTEWGAAVVERLDGMFAFAIWDRARRDLFLARDRLGKKPLHWAVLPDGLAFGSELGCFAGLPGVSRRIDPASLDDYLALGYVPDPATIFADIRKLQPAHHLTFHAGRRTGARARPVPVRYWRAATAKSGSEHDAGADAASLRFALLEATRARMIADVPLGAFLSGGLDSAAVLAAACRLDPARPPIGAFTIGFDGADDETGAARAIARHCGATPHDERGGGIDWIGQALRQGAVFGEPFGDSSAIPTAQVCAFARRHVTVALSGDGGDEVFAGYRRHRWHLLVESARRHLPRRFREGPIAGLARLYPKLDRAPRFLRAKATLTELGLSSALGYYRTMARTDDRRRRALLHPRIASASDGHDPGTRFETLMDAHAGEDPIVQAQQVDLATWLPGQMLTKVDRTSMRHGLEVRCPLLDHRIVEWGVGLPAARKLRRGRGKAVLRDAVAPWLPPEILARPKQGFAIPLAGVLRREGARVRSHLLDPAFLEAELVRPEAVGRLLDEHEGGRLDHAQPIWLLLVLAGFVATELAR